MKQYANLNGIEIMYVAGEEGTTVALDDVARALGYDFAVDLEAIISLLDLEKETFEIRTLPRGVVDMITLAASVKIAEAFDSREGTALAMFLRTQIPMSKFDRDRYNNLSESTISLLRARQSVSRLLENHPNANGDFIAERIGIRRDEANYLLTYVRKFQMFEASGRAGDVDAAPRPDSQGE